MLLPGFCVMENRTVRPTINDIAREASVSLATVDRVINDRPGVREQTIERVQKAITRLGYVRDVSAANLARQRTYRMVFIIPRGQSEFLGALRDTINECTVSAHTDRTDVRLLTVTMREPRALARVLNTLDVSEVDGVALLAPETPQIQDAIRRLKEDGVAIVALVSDLPNSDRDHFAGINNIAAGRTAGVLMGRFVADGSGSGSGSGSGKILVLAGSMQSYDSTQRRQGFDQVVAESFPQLVVLPSLESHDDPERMMQLIENAMLKHKKIRGIYSIGSGNRILTRCLDKLDCGKRPVVVAHELTSHTRQSLKCGVIDVIITQNLGHIVRSALRVLRAKCDQRDFNPSQERIRIDIVLKENLM